MPIIIGTIKKLKKMKKLAYIALILMIFQSCKQKAPQENNTALPLPEVQITHPIKGNIQENEQVNAQVVFLNKTAVTAPITGYVTRVNTKFGYKVRKGQLLYQIQTKESRALQKSNLKPSGQFGVVSVYAPTSGYVSSQTIPDAGTFVNEGNELLTIIKNTDLAIQVNAPFALAKLIKGQKNIAVELPYKEVKAANYYKTIPTVDAVSQTQKILFKLKKYTPLPENLNVLIKIPVTKKRNSILLPKQAVLTNETQDKFWIMKVNNQNLAIQVPIKKGLENKTKIEILQPKLDLKDNIILSGAYGLPDSTKVKIVK
ncbi:MAG TPA: HlyD family efflux transporter periplasmic adaptor subunit [Flavobacteriales bacterium]|jgi:multidrug efflux pump subunit AcrA (membrane-fusion protein)|nr:HlyD family efflux transporter periplasmic adaptor subunit [Flavobacteriales bacterium]